MERILISIVFYSLICLVGVISKYSKIKKEGKIYLKGFSIFFRDDWLRILLFICFFIVLILISVFALNYYEIILLVIFIILFSFILPFNYYLTEWGVITSLYFPINTVGMKYISKTDIKDIVVEDIDNKKMVTIILNKKNKKILIKASSDKEKIIQEWVDKMKN